MLRLAWKYLRYDKSQTLAILCSIILTAALLSGIGSLLYSGQRNDLEHARESYGDWHYAVEVSKKNFRQIQGAERGDGYELLACGKVILRGVEESTGPIWFLQADAEYLKMQRRELTRGRYPQAADEIAADRYVLNSLGFLGDVGDTVSLDGKDYLLTGIVQTRRAMADGEMEIFVGEAFAGEDLGNYIYLKFDEGEKLYRQFDAFCRAHGLSGERTENNEEVTAYLGGEKPDTIREIFHTAVTEEGAGFTYAVLKLQSEYNLAFRGMIFLLCIFGVFIIYSIFQNSVSKRMAEYGVMQTIGIGGGRIAGTLILELWMLFLAGYPIGCLLGNETLQILRDTDHIYPAWSVMEGGFVFLFLMLGLVGVLTVHAMRKRTLIQVMGGDASVTRSRKIYSLSRQRLVDIVVRKFMFPNWKKTAGILISLSLGGAMFFCTTYLVENLKVHAQMALKSDDGLGSDFRISVKSDSIADVIPETSVDSFRETDGVSKAHAVKFTIGELLIPQKEIRWKHYFDEQNKDAVYIERYGGICVEKEKGLFGIKYDVYGYDAGLMEQLEDFILEGEIDQEEMEKEDLVIVTANEDGQGNYDLYGKHPGDTITLRVPKDPDVPSDVLKFQSGEEYYITREYKIAAVVSRALAQEEGYLIVDSWRNGGSVIMTNRQMERQYGITDYGFVHLTLAEGADAETVGTKLWEKLQDVPGAVLRDFTSEIQNRRAYLERQQMFFSGVAVILLAISLFHIMNSMNYAVLARRREYGIIRAMGITDGGLYRMILKTGLWYGLLTDLVLFLGYHLVLRRGMDYYMQHVVQFLHIQSGIPAGTFAAVMGLNLVIAVTAVLIPARKIVRANVIGEMNGE